jgi:hypothetical protein
MLKERGGASIYPAVEQAPEAEQALPKEEARAFSSALAWPAYSASSTLQRCSQDLLHTNPWRDGAAIVTGTA